MSDSTKVDRSASGLTRIERFNTRAVELWHAVPPLSMLSRFFGRYVARTEFALIMHNVVEWHDFERLRNADVSRSIIVCGNHRSYLDPFAMAVKAIPLLPHGTRFIAPPRTEGLFDKPWGLFLNLLLTGMNMYPPVIRSSRGAMWGKQVINLLIELLNRGRIALFIHPEGGRNKGPDPYSLNPAKPGLGKIIHSTQAEVYPVFLQGFPSSPKAMLKAKILRKRGSPPLVHAVMGPPLDFSAERSRPASPEVYREIGRRLMDAIRDCAERERAIRAAEPATQPRPGA